MGLGLNEKFNILQSSPLDLSAAQCGSAISSPDSTVKTQKWVPSRYNIRATTDDGSLILWNTFSSSMSVFRPEQVQAVKDLLKRQGFEGDLEGLAGYLHKRGYLVKAGVDEFRQVQAAINQQQYRTDVLELILLASEDCNFRCRYCYEEFARGTMLPEVRNSVKKLVGRRAKQLQRLHISWFGGEPLYGFDAIADLAPFFIETVERYDLAFFSHMTTNGYLLSPEVVDKLFEWRIKHYQITIDGPEDNHDFNRPTREGDGTFLKIFSNLKNMAKRDDDFSVIIRVNFDKQNKDRLHELLNKMRDDLESDERFIMRFHAVGQWEGPNDEQLQVCGKDETEMIIEDMRREALKRGLKVNTLRDINRIGGDVCYAARPYNFIVGATGKLMKCTITLDRKDYNVVGMLDSEGELDLDKDKIAMWTEPAFERDTKCQKCLVLPLCNGTHCPEIRILEDKSPCTTTRHSAKSQMVEVFEQQYSASRKIDVNAST